MCVAALKNCLFKSEILMRIFSHNSFKFRDCHGASSGSIIVEKLGAVTTVGINRPEKRNCIDMNTAERLNDAIENFEADNDSLVAVLYGKGGNFCAGFDLQELTTISDVTKIREVISHGPLKGLGPMGPTRKIFKKPVIAAISGYAVAGGFELALACDLRVVEETAVMGVFNRRFGVPLVDGGTVRLPALIGLSRAMDLILTGRPINAKEALEWGLANRYVAVGTALGQGVNLARSLSKFPQQCLLADRASAYEAALSPSTAFLQETAAAISNLELMKEAVDGATRFSSEGTGKHGKFNLEGNK
ncbi:short-chain-enoyl-CoA hydratase-like [Ischnura elegans]|uniref:short-chain-enoyl-CoA hydratase-like n=1 Tax=Ischnura elegans TaxID=197161 RepID=UPI001ED89FEF|nr:short-chain-enoyl-CoA hydratase-like [Ischnura elegans]